MKRMLYGAALCMALAACESENNVIVCGGYEVALNRRAVCRRIK